MEDEGVKEVDDGENEEVEDDEGLKEEVEGEEGVKVEVEEGVKEVVENKGVKEEVEDEEGVKAKVEEEEWGGKDVRGGGMEGEGRPGGGNRVKVEGETSAYRGNDTHINSESQKLNAEDFY